MKFPVFSAIEAVTYNKLSGVVLKIDGNAGEIPPSFQFAVLTSEDDGSQVCTTGVSKMTDDQWDNWTDQDSETYILECVAAKEGFTLVKPSAAGGASVPGSPTTKKTRR